MTNLEVVQQTFKKYEETISEQLEGALQYEAKLLVDDVLDRFSNWSEQANELLAEAKQNNNQFDPYTCFMLWHTAKGVDHHKEYNNYKKWEFKILARVISQEFELVN